MNADHSLQPCSDSELRSRQEKLNRAKGHMPKGYLDCKDRDGNPAACPDDLKKAQNDTKFVKAQQQAQECLRSGGDKEKCPPQMQAKMHDLAERLKSGPSGQ
jgi:hypothetical protein